MDKIDISIIRALQQNGKLTNQELSDKIGLSPSPCLRRVRILENNGTIRGYSASVDQKAYGLPITIFVHIRLQSHTGEVVQKFEQSVRDLENVLECYLLAGSDDYLLRVALADLEEYNEFLREKIHKIPGIASIDSHFAVDEIKRTSVFPMRRA